LEQIATEEKSNEITAILELIDEIDIQGAVATIDVMGCQKEIAKKIKNGGGEYVLAEFISKRLCTDFTDV